MTQEQTRLIYHIGQQVKDKMREINITQQDLALEVGLDRKQVRYLMEATLNYDIKTLTAIVIFLDLDLDLKCY